MLTLEMLGGCVLRKEEQKQYVSDSDGDGYPDDIDDFPNDANFHEKSYAFKTPAGANYGYETTTEVEAHGGHGWGGMVESHWKFVVIKADVIGPAGFTYEQGKNFSIEVRQEDYDKRLVLLEGPHIYARIPVTMENFGTWFFGLLNYNKDIALTVRYEIYKMR